MWLLAQQHLLRVLVSMTALVLANDVVAQPAGSPAMNVEASSAEAASGLPRGVVVPEFISASDPTQTFAIYLPTEYEADRTWPLLLVMDPRGRAVESLELFQEAAERFGWIVLSAHGTRSDVNSDPNTPAAKAMLADAHANFSINRQRLYLAGMSGTARYAWIFGRHLVDRVTGVIGVGGGLPNDDPSWTQESFAFHGLAGTLDFNYQEMAKLDASLAAVGSIHRFTTFSGPHGWAPAEACGEAVAWLELLAMRQGLTPTRSAFVEARLAQDRAEGERLRTTDPLAAYRQFDQITRDFDSLIDVSTDRATAIALNATKAVQAQRKQEQKLAAAERSYNTVIQEWLHAMAGAERPLPIERSLARLQIKKLQRGAAGRDPREAFSAQRRLETIYVQTSFYLPQAYQARQRFDRALAVLAIATKIKAESARPYWQMASVHAQLGHLDQAFAAIDQASQRGPVDWVRVAADPQWQPLRDDPRWSNLMKSNQ